MKDPGRKIGTGFSGGPALAAWTASKLRFMLSETDARVERLFCSDSFLYLVVAPLSDVLLLVMGVCERRSGEKRGDYYWRSGRCSCCVLLAGTL